MKRRVRFLYGALFISMKLDELIDKLHSIKEIETPGTSVLERWRKYYPFIIKEGLIKTYPDEAVAHIIAQLYKLKLDNWDYGENGKIFVDNKEHDDSRIIIIIFNSKEEIFDGVNNHMLKYGWFLAEQEYKLEGIELIYEKKFGDRYSVDDILSKQGGKFLYHITSTKIAEKIKKQGFVPKSHTEEYLKGSKFKSGDDINNRIYFFIQEPDESFVRTWGSTAVSRTGGEPVLITVNPEFINKNVSFFVDPRWPMAVFTYEPIPPNAIYSIEEKEL